MIILDNASFSITLNRFITSNVNLQFEKNSPLCLIEYNHDIQDSIAELEEWTTDINKTNVEGHIINEGNDRESRKK